MMRLTPWTDYSLRVQMYCAACEQREQRSTVGEIAQAHGISRSHLTKIVMTLSGLGLLETTREGGQRVQFLPGLPRPPETAARRKQVSASGESR